jgi:hypothetical protein
MTVMVGRSVRRGGYIEYARFDEKPQSVGEYIARNAKTLLKLAEAAYAIECVTHDQERPALPDYIKSSCDRTRRIRKTPASGHPNTSGVP